MPQNTLHKWIDPTYLISMNNCYYIIFQYQSLYNKEALSTEN